MLTLSDEARDELDAYFTNQEASPVRVYMAPGGCSGPRLALTLDAPGDEDLVLESKGHVFCVNKALLERTGGIHIALSDFGFAIRPEHAAACAAQGCASCSGACPPEE